MTLKQVLEVCSLNLSLRIENNKCETVVENIQIGTYFECDCYRVFDSLQVGYIDTYTDYETGLQVMYIAQSHE